MQKILLPSSALAYMQESINGNSHFLSIAPIVQMFKGTPYTYVPDQYNILYLTSYRGGSLFFEKRDESHKSQDRIHDELLHFLQTENAVCLIMDGCYGDKEGGVNKIKLNRGYIEGFFKDRLYAIVFHKNITRESLVDAIRNTLSPGPYYGLLSLPSLKLQKEIATLHEKDFPQELIDEILRNAVGVFVGAYDGEGYIYQNKDDKKPVFLKPSVLHR